MQSADTEDILFEVLKASTELQAAVSGGIYQNERPDGSEAEDIVINSIHLTHTAPQSGTSNINIHVTDLKLKIGGKEQRKRDRERLRILTNLVLEAIKEANVTGLTFWVENETTIQELLIKQHYTNLRIGWNIQRTEN